MSAQYRPAFRTPRSRRLLAAAAALPLLLGALAACRLRLRQARRHRPPTTADAAANATAGAKKLSADEVKIGYFANLTHATALVGLARKASSRRSWAAPRSSTPTFNAGPSEIEALNAGSIDIGWIGPSPAINGYTKSKGKNLRIIARFGVRRREAGRQPEEDQVPGRCQGQEDRHPAARQHPGRGVPQLDRRAGLEGRRRRAARATSRWSARTTRSPRTPTSPAPSTAPGCPSRPRPSWSPRAARCCSTRATLWPGKKFVITNIIVSQKFLKEHPEVVEAVLRGSVKTNEWINANPDAGEGRGQRGAEGS